MPGQQGGTHISCPQCGSGLAPTARFCGVCGHTLNSRNIAQYPTRSQHRTQTAITVAAAPQSAPPTSDTLTPAGRGVRCASYLLDIAAMMSPALPLSTAGALLGVAEVVYVVIPVAFVAVWLWLQIWQGLTGNTFGKAMLGLRLVHTNDLRPPGLVATLLRSLIFVATFGLAALPVVLSPTPAPGLHDRLIGLTVLDVTSGANPLGARQETTLRRSSDRGLNRVHSPIPVAQSRRG